MTAVPTPPSGPLSPRHIKQVLDAAGISESDRREFMTHLQTVVTTDTDDLELPSSAADRNAWTATLSRLLAYLTSATLTPQNSLDAVQDVEDDDEVLTVKLTQQQFQVWKELKKALDTPAEPEAPPEPGNADEEEEESEEEEEEEKVESPAAEEKEDDKEIEQVNEDTGSDVNDEEQPQKPVKNWPDGAMDTDFFIDSIVTDDDDA
jgi:hypothetical protein